MVKRIIYCLIICFFAKFAECGELVLSVVEKEFDVKVKMSSKRGLDFGVIKSSEKSRKKIVIENKTECVIEFNNWRSPCSCLEFSGQPDVLKPGKEVKVTAVLDGSGYRGSFSKFMYIGFNVKEILE